MKSSRHFCTSLDLYFTGCASERVMDVALSEINEWMFERGTTYVIFLQNSQGKKNNNSLFTNAN